MEGKTIVQVLQLKEPCLIVPFCESLDIGVVMVLAKNIDVPDVAPEYKATRSLIRGYSLYYTSPDAMSNCISDYEIILRAVMENGELPSRFVLAMAMLKNATECTDRIYKKIQGLRSERGLMAYLNANIYTQRHFVEDRWYQRIHDMVLANREERYFGHRYSTYRIDEKAFKAIAMMSSADMSILVRVLDESEVPVYGCLIKEIL